MKFVLILLGLLLTYSFHSQIGTGQWRFHTSTTKAIDIAVTESKIFTAFENGLFILDLSNNEEVTVLNVINGLSDISISTLYWDASENALFIGYKNGNIDKYKNGVVYNIPAIKLASIANSKNINHFIRFGNFVYAATDFAIVQINPVKNEVRETFYPTNGNESINDITFSGDTIFALTPSKLLRGIISNPALPDPSQWEVDNRLEFLSQNQYKEIETVNDKQFVLYQNLDFGKDSVFLLTNIGKTLVSNSPYSLEIFSINKIDNTKIAANMDGGIAVYDANTLMAVGSYITNNLGVEMAITRSGLTSKGMWASDKANCLYFMPTEVSIKNYTVTGASNNYFYSIDSQKGKSAFSSGYLIGKLPAFSKNGIHFFEGENWSFLDTYKQSCWEGKNIWDIIDISINPLNLNEFAACTYSEVPLTIFNNNQGEIFTEDNSTLKSTYMGNGWSLVSDVCYDEKGNLWSLNGYCERPLNVKSAEDGNWMNFDLGFAAKNKYTKKMIVDFNGNIWCATENAGLFGYNTSGTLSNSTDDKRINLKTGENYGNLPSENITAIAADFEGEIWIGTDAGFAILYAANSAFDANPGEYDAQRVKVQYEGNVEYVLGSTHITDIEVDGGNRKWIATANAGILLLSPDGSEIIEQHTTENSPLISDIIYDIKLDQTTGELFIITDKGLISYRTNATYEDPDYASTTIFPNPVRPSYQGPVTIQGIRYNSDVKITDAAGNLVYKTNSNGGTATWDCKNLNGERVATGVYLIWTAMNEGKDKKVGKVLVVN
jgi:hypothetical protein